ncbi:MAG: hypothetical protein C0596_07940 [Marinilabiliales bacterium]|nr:MAG: hypothetical protein C0596_07940 [Marinilabiliales bacterium]
MFNSLNSIVLWNIEEKKVAIPGTGARIAPNGRHLTMMSVTQNQLQASCVMNVKPKNAKVNVASNWHG